MLVPNRHADTIVAAPQRTRPGQLSPNFSPRSTARFLPALTPANMLVLQRLAGNQAVLRLLSSPGEGVAVQRDWVAGSPPEWEPPAPGKKKAGAEEVEPEQDARNKALSEKHAELVEATLINEEDQVFHDPDNGLILVHHVPEGEEEEASGTLYTFDDGDWTEEELADDPLTDLVELAEGKFTEAPGDTRLGTAFKDLGLKDEVVATLMGSGASIEHLNLILTKTKAKDLVERLVNDIGRDEGESLAKLIGVFEFNDANKKYPEATLAKWLLAQGRSTTFNTLKRTAAHKSVRWVELCFEHLVNAKTPKPHQELIQLKAGLLEAFGSLAVYKADKRYPASDPASTQRTGFQYATFTGGAQAEVHTHWHTTDGKMTSMHVQENGKNGIEFQTRAGFGDVATSVVAAHNSATGTKAPTSTVTPLTL